MNKKKQKAVESLEVCKKRFSELLGTFRSRVEQSKVIAEEKKKDIIAQIENLQVQLGSGRADTGSALARQKWKIREAAKMMEAHIDRGIKDFSEGFDLLAREMTDAANALHTAMEDLEVLFNLEKMKAASEQKE